MIIKNASIYTEDHTFVNGNAVVENGRFVSFSDFSEQDAQIVDAQGLYMIPGLVDIHFHGCMGADMCDGTKEALDIITRYEASIGVTSVCPATMTIAKDELLNVMKNAGDYAYNGGAHLVGINMEGPFISASKKGAQAEENILHCDYEYFCRLQKAAKGLIKLVDLAPEESGAMEFIEKAKDEVVISLAHTAFADLEDDMILAESMLKYVIRYVMENAPEEMNFFNSFVDKGLIDRLNNVVNSDFARVTYTEAIEILEKHNDKFEYKVSWGADLQTEHERYLTEEIYKRPVFVTDYPKEIKAFYMKMNDDNKTVAAVDCLVPGIGEIIGGSQREDDYDKLVARMKELGLKEEDYGFYLDLRKYGSTRHAGFGLGFERCIMYLTGMSNIRDVIPFPRTVNNCEL